MKINKIIIITICFIVLSLAIPVIIFYITFSNFPLSHQVQDWSNFGSYIGGIYSALFGFMSTVIVCLTLFFTIKNNKEQTEHMRKEHLSTLIGIYAQSLNDKLDKKVYEYCINEEGTRQKSNEADFLSYALRRYTINENIDILSNNEKHPNDKRKYFPNIFKIGSKTISELKLSYDPEIGNLITILDLIESSHDKASRKELLNQFQAITHRNRMFWLMLYAYFNVPSVRESVAFDLQLLIPAEGIAKKNWMD